MPYTDEEAAILAEIFFLRLETSLRASQETISPKKVRFVPLSAAPFLASQKGRPQKTSSTERQLGSDAKSKEKTQRISKSSSRARASHYDANGAFVTGSARESASHG